MCRIKCLPRAKSFVYREWQFREDIYVTISHLKEPVFAVLFFYFFVGQFLGFSGKLDVPPSSVCEVLCDRVRCVKIIVIYYLTGVSDVIEVLQSLSEQCRYTMMSHQLKSYDDMLTIYTCINRKNQK